MSNSNDNKIVGVASNLVGAVGLATIQTVSEHVPDTITINLLEAKKKISTAKNLSEISPTDLFSGVHVSAEYKDAKKKQIVSDLIKEVLKGNKKKMINVTPKKK